MNPGDDEIDDEVDEEELDEPDDGDASHFPWEDVEASRRDERLQRRHARDLRNAMGEFKGTSCAGCGRPAAELACFYFESPDETWAQLCGAGGWMRVCDACRRQVEFVYRIQN